ncbi:hypothetical protein J7E81_15240 [Bacillus sp. ISL-18]|uniref:hypothetical protein n=1 Tax=Bacillus sp. ISL-18 TaxID=2819118 RepID=UPI001BEC95C0|nr:hypothetical protein [Bacillus sp. ISL-18]MBT2656572.1 hypothetical protein [Bacillus sp. ISL-18]
MALNLPISHSAEIQCPNCDEKFNLNFKIQDIEHEETNERQMGPEMGYSFIEEVKCPDCNHEFEIEGEVWEYPEGALNFIEMR